MSWVPPDGPAVGRPAPVAAAETWAHADPGSPRAPVPAPPRRGRRALAVVVAVALVVAAAGAAVLLRDDDDPDGTASGRDPGEVVDDPATSSPPAPDDDEGEAPTTSGLPATETALEATVAELSEHVVAVRGRPFPEPVTVELVDDAAFNERLLVDFEEEREDLDLLGRLLVAVGLADPADDLFEIYREFLGAGVLGFYDPETGELVVRGAAITAYTRSTIVHELAHAYDDQHFELHRPALDEAEDERGLGFAALVEGNAVRVQQLWEAELTRDEQEQLFAEQLEAARGIDVGSIPPVLLQQVEFPYSEGATLAEALAEEGGEAAVDAAFADPPTTSEQVIDPGAYLSGEGALPVPIPPADGPVVDQGAYGQLTLTITLAHTLDRETAREAADGWGGDAYVAWTDGDRTCVRMAFRMDTEDDLVELTDAWDAWAEEHPDAEVVADDETVTVTACA